MLKISTRLDYGVRAMLDLALRANGEPVQCHDIAARQSIPEPYLNQILGSLRRDGLIESRRGPGGGHRLARSAHDIGMREIVEALDKPDLPDDRPKGSCAATLFDLWQDVGESARRAVEGVTLADLADRTRTRAPTYHI